jgi:hypothetical protein
LSEISERLMGAVPVGLAAKAKLAKPASSVNNRLRFNGILIMTNFFY